jgi:CubicO group peptidase (beta-lactamase class C family)
MKSLILLTALIALPASAAEVGLPAVHEALTQAVASKTIPGGIVVVRRNGKVVFREAAGAIDGEALKPDTVFWVASMTKPLVATSVMMMVEQGKVSLDDPVSKFIPAFAKPRMVRVLKPGSPPADGGPKAPPPQYDLVPAVRPLVVRDLITMSGGLQTIRVANAAIAPLKMNETLKSFTDGLGDVPLDFQPSTRWAYSNATQFDVLARIVEVASGQSYRDFMYQHLFGPLGMKDTGFGVRPDLAARVVPANDHIDSPLRYSTYTSGSAGLWTTADDYSRFAQMLLNGGTLDGRRYLKPETVKAMSSNQIGERSLAGIPASAYGGLPAKTNPAIKYGFGMMNFTDAAAAGVPDVPAGSFGWDGVGTRRFWVMPKTHTVLVMLIGGGQADAAHRQIEAALAKSQ